MKGVLVLLLAVGLTAAACGGHKSSSGKKTALTISNEQGTTWTCGFSPFNSDVNFLSSGTVYEQLTFVNGLKSGQTKNWLASSYKWSNANKTLTFTIRKGVKWTDGKPFTAADVLYTFNLIKKYPALDLNASWAVLKSVTQNGNQIVFQFKTAAVPYFYYIADQTDRQKVAEVGEYGYEPASNQTGIVTPTFQSWLDQGLAHQVTYNPAKAVAILKAAGYKKKGDQFYTPDGKPLSFRMINIGG